jgi:hypothetical protein
MRSDVSWNVMVDSFLWSGRFQSMLHNTGLSIIVKPLIISTHPICFLLKILIAKGCELFVIFCNGDGRVYKHDNSNFSSYFCWVLTQNLMFKLWLKLWRDFKSAIWGLVLGQNCCAKDKIVVSIWGSGTILYYVWAPIVAQSRKIVAWFCLNLNTL